MSAIKRKYDCGTIAGKLNKISIGLNNDSQQ